MFTTALSESQVFCTYAFVTLISTFLVALLVAGFLGVFQNRSATQSLAGPDSR